MKLKSRLFDKNTLFCFSPTVMMITALSEVALALYAYRHYKQTKIGILGVLTLLFLALFQISEYQICEGLPALNLFWTKVGLIAITLLPPLGLHITEMMTNQYRFWWVGYVCALIYSVLFIFNPAIVQGGVCAGNYVIIDMQRVAYGEYYFAFLFLAMFIGLQAIRKQQITKASLRESVRWLILGYATFILPVAAVYMIVPSTLHGVPSIMCGFALVFAFILALRVLPLYHKKSTE